MGIINLSSGGSVPARVASQSQVCEECPECIINSLSSDLYPATLTISSSGEANRLYPELMGDYNKIPGKFRNGRPVWKHTYSNAEFNYDYIYEDNYWLVKSDTVKISSEDSLLEQIPVRRWLFYDYTLSRWIMDETMIVQGW